jgi:hypothetical protein
MLFRRRGRFLPKPENRASVAAMLRPIIAGQTDAQKLAALGSERLSATRDTLAIALDGKVTALVHPMLLIAEPGTVVITPAMRLSIR